MTAAGLRLRAEPLSALVDELVCIQVTGAMPHTLVTIAARAMDGTGEQWSAQAVFRSGPEGDVDVAAQRPLMGSYESVDPMGLFWSMVPDGNSDMLLPVTGGEAVSVSLVARTERGTTSPEVILTRHFRHRDTRRIAIRASGLVGTLFRRENAPLAPGVVVLGGSGGGAPEDIAGLLASYGLTTLALAYFGALPLPAALVEIPLEYVRNAILWLRAQDGVRPGRISIVGRSRGGELALLAGATFSEVGAVVAYVPSALTWWGLQGGGWSGRSAWSYRGRGLPCPGRPLSGTFGGRPATARSRGAGSSPRCWPTVSRVANRQPSKSSGSMAMFCSSRAAAMRCGLRPLWPRWRGIAVNGTAGRANISTIPVLAMPSGTLMCQRQLRRSVIRLPDDR